MAKSNSFFGLRQGSTKSHTYQILRGVQITKDRVYHVSNPQSALQMQQRLKLPLVANARSILATLVNHSFEGINYGDASLKYFSSENLRNGTLNVTEWVPKGGSDCGLADFLISKGTLPVLTVKPALRADFSSTEVGTSAPNAVNFASGTTIATDRETSTIEVGAIASDEAVGTALSIFATALGLQDKDQLTFLTCIPGVSSPFNVGTTQYDAHHHNFIVSRIVLGIDETVNSSWKVTNSTQTDGGKTTSSITLTDGYVTVQFANTNCGFYVSNSSVYSGNAGDIESAAIIVSRKNTDNSYKRSTNRMTVLKSAGSPKYETVLPTYVANVSSSDKYLNSGNEGVDITGGSTVLSANA